MNLTKQVGLVVGAAALTLTSASFADTTAEANNNDLKAKVAELEAQMAQMRAQQNDNWLTEQRADEIRGLVQDVLADADTRASLLAQGMSSGYDDGFVLSSADANFLLRINGQLQTRWVYNNSDGGLEGLDQGDVDAVLQDLVDEELGVGVLILDDPASVAGFVGGAIGLDAAEIADLTDALEEVQEEFGSILRFVDQSIAGLSSSDKDLFAQALGFDDFAEYQADVVSFGRAVITAEIMARGGDDSDRSGFENTRTKLWFTGHVINPSWQYVIEADFFHGGGGAFALRDAYIAYDYGNGWKAMMGQWKAPFLREELVDARYQLAVERSLLNSNFTGGRIQGVGFDYRGDQLHFSGAYSNGATRTNSTALTYDTEWAFTARGEYLLSGTWDQFTDFTSPSGEETGVLIGVAIHVEEEEFGTGRPLLVPPVPNNDELETVMITADVSAEFGGANLYGAFVYRSLDSNATGDLDQIGFLVQGGYYLNDDWEGFVRYEWADFDMPDLRAVGVSVYSWDDLSVITFGVNRYFAGHQAKWTTDIGIALDRVEFFAADPRAGYRSDTGGDDGQVVIRTQLQLLF